MKELGLLMKPPLVRATLADRKTMTRRLLDRLLGYGFITDFHPSDTTKSRWTFQDKKKRLIDLSHAQLLEACPYGVVGDHLYVRETWRLGEAGDCACYEPCGKCPVGKILFLADFPSPPEGWKWKPSIHMEKEYSRIILEIVDVRIERLKDISEEDAKAEGVSATLNPLDSVKLGATGTYKEGFFQVWQAINGVGSCEANPWVWVISYKRVK